ncbi:Fructosamine kinase-domain-containing protein [Chaetomium fimeti]|uniref:protein-ribulosamine 3-kinase n=1 Tax=Chaetomium fimeti TaxID=1854472 RepID=A0AAE0HMW8_9PEZI|nr:Fructosamine kinase-domain-containing protein [Chaetomium fimeti]
MVLKNDRHTSSEAPVGPVVKPQVRGPLELDAAVVKALPVPGSKLVSAREYGSSLWGGVGKITVDVPGEGVKDYFLKTVNQGNIGRAMVHGEFESLNAIHTVFPDFAPQPHAWGQYEDSQTWFLLTEFRHIGKQPAEPVAFTERLAELHKKSTSPTGKFGFHMTTCHAKLPQAVNGWEDSWAVLYRKQMIRMIKLDEETNGVWPEFKAVSQLLVDKVIPRLLEPLQSDGRSIKPCLVHGDLWDENTAMDAVTGKPFIFDPCCFYAHNEYEMGNWRAARVRLSAKEYIEGYKQSYPPSEPQEEWDDRNLLYSLRFDLGCAINIPGPSNPQRPIVKDNMTLLCAKFFPEELRSLQNTLAKRPQE